MSFIEAIILGLVQGLTEFLPISSSAHLRIVGEFLPSKTDPGATFTAITQLGTEAAVIIYFRKDIARIIGRWFRSLSSAGGSRSIPRDSVPGTSTRPPIRSCPTNASRKSSAVRWAPSPLNKLSP